MPHGSNQLAERQDLPRLARATLAATPIYFSFLEWCLIAGGLRYVAKSLSWKPEHVFQSAAIWLISWAATVLPPVWAGYMLMFGVPDGWVRRIKNGWVRAVAQLSILLTLMAATAVLERAIKIFIDALADRVH